MVWDRSAAERSDDDAGSPANEGQAGQGMVEYALILVLVAMVLLAIVMVLGRQTNTLYSNISNGLNQ